MTWRTTKPHADEHHPFYGTYVREAPAGDVVDELLKQTQDVQTLLGSLPEAKGDYRYAEGKWSVKEVVLHLADSERVFAYRALTFARGDATELPGFDENAWVPAADAGRRTLGDVLREFAAVRAATVCFLRSVDEAAAARRGTANGTQVTVRALAWITLGHTRHHLDVLRTRYLAG